MRIFHKVGRSKINLKYIFNIFFNIFSEFFPKIILKKIMEHKFMDFGMEITNICNANCTFCAYRYQKKKKKVLDFKNFKKIIDQYSELGGGPLGLTPTVGDPLVDPEILEKIKYARSKKNIASIFLYTNGILINKFGYKNLLDSGLSRLAISTYVGSSEGYFKYYQKNQYNTVINNIIEITKLSKVEDYKCKITLHLRVESEKIWKDTDDYKRISAYVNDEDISYLTSYDSWSGKITIDDLPVGCTISKSISSDQKIKSGPCFELYRRLNVLEDLKVGACVCVDLESEINVGSLEKNNLEEIWKGKKINQIRNDWSKGKLPEVCKSCTRYDPIDNFILKNKSEILKRPIQRFLKLFSH